MAERCVNTLIDTTSPYPIDLCLAIDNDQETAERLLDIEDYPLRFDIACSYEENYRGCSKAWNDALSLSKGDPVVLAADDLEWQPGWLENALQCLSRFPDGWGFVGFNDGHWNQDLSTHYLVSRRFIVEVLGGVIAWEHYRHSFNDVEINERAKQADRYVWCEDARVYHSHWLFGDRPQDHTDARSLPDHPRSQQMFLQRQAAGFPSDYPAVIS
jgi:Glycosyl transferase family 2